MNSTGAASYPPPPSLLEVLSLEGTCLCRELLYKDNDFHLNLGFKFSTQTMVFTLNLVSRKGSLHSQWFESIIWFHEKVPYTNNSSAPFSPTQWKSSVIGEMQQHYIFVQNQSFIVIVCLLGLGNFMWLI